MAGATRELLAGHRDSINCVDVSSDGHLLASASDDSSCRIWDLATDKTVRCIAGAFGQESVNSVCFSPKLAHAVFAASGSTIFEFDLRKEGVVLTEPSTAYETNNEEINQIVVHPKKGNYLAAADDSGDITLIDIEKRKHYRTLSRAHESICNCVAFRPKVNYDLISGALDTSIAYWDISRGRLQHLTKFSDAAEQEFADGEGAVEESQQTKLFNPPFVYSMDFTSDGRSFAAGLGDGVVSVFDFKSRSSVLSLQAHATAVNQVKFVGQAGCDSQCLLSAGNDQRVLLWKLSLQPPKQQVPDKTKSSKSKRGSKQKNVQLPQVEADQNVSSGEIVHEFLHSHKSNWIVPWSGQESESPTVFVADVSKYISKYIL